VAAVAEGVMRQLATSARRDTRWTEERGTEEGLLTQKDTAWGPQREASEGQQRYKELHACAIINMRGKDGLGEAASIQKTLRRWGRGDPRTRDPSNIPLQQNLRVHRSYYLTNLTILCTMSIKTGF
jgi:hypothetical protein